MRKPLVILFLIFAINAQASPTIDSTKYYRVKLDSVRRELVRANLKIIMVKYYLKITNKNPKKFGGFLRGWINGLFENQ